VLIHARDTVAALDSQLDETIVTPVGSPRVLHDPVCLILSNPIGVAAAVGVVISISVSPPEPSATLHIAPFAAQAVRPPISLIGLQLLSIASARSSTALSSRSLSAEVLLIEIIIIIIVIIVIVVIVIIVVAIVTRLVQADNDDSVVDTLRAVVGSAEDSCLVEPPAAIASSYSDGHGALIVQLLHHLHVLVVSLRD
jgi:type III secretory pathway component EscS